MKKSIKDTKKDIKQVSVKQAKAIYLSVLLLVVAIFGTGAYYLFNINNGNNTVQEQSYLTDITDTDGDGYLDSVDSDPENWNVGDRDLLMFATLAYEPAQGTVYVDNGKGNWEKKKIDYVCTESATEDCKDNIDNVTGKNLGYMIDENHMVGMRPKSYSFLSGIIFNGWKVVGKDYYFAGKNEFGNTEYYASVNEVKNWVIVDYTSESVVDKDKEKILKDGGIDGANFEATTFKLDNNIVIAFRGTDFPDLLEWFIETVEYGGKNNLQNYETAAKNYAKRIMIKYVAEYEKGDAKKAPKFYITGHSLGGYLAQIAAVEIIENAPTIKPYLKDVVYFNGMGLNFSSATADFSKWTEENAKSDQRYIDLVAWADEKDENGEQKHRVICYCINGDIISTMGVHVQKIGFYAAPGAVRRHMADSTVGQQLTRNALVNTLVSKIASFVTKLTDSNFVKASKYLDYYNNIYGKSISVLDLMWFAHEPSAGFFYNIKQGTRGGAEKVNVTTTVGSAKLGMIPITLTAETTGDVVAYQWYKNDVAIEGANSSSYELEKMMAAKFKDRYTVKVTIERESDGELANKTITGIAYIDSIAPDVSFASSKWQTKRYKELTITVRITDENGFTDSSIGINDFKVKQIFNNIKVTAVSVPKVSPDGKTITVNVTIGGILGYGNLALKKGAVVDGYGNQNSEMESKLIKVTLF